MVRIEEISGSYEWKIADAGWTVEYCPTVILAEDMPNHAPTFGCQFPFNGTIDVPVTGCYEFTTQADGSVSPLSVDLALTRVN